MTAVGAGGGGTEAPSGGRSVLHVVPSFFPAHRYGGPVQSLYELCLAQQRAGVRVRVLTSDAGTQAGERAPGPFPARFLNRYADGFANRCAGRAWPEALLGAWTEAPGMPVCYAPVWLGEDVAPGVALRLAAELRRAAAVHVTGVFSVTSGLGLLGAALSRRSALVVSPRGALLPWALAQGRAAEKRAILRALAPLWRRVDGWHLTSEEEAAALRALGLVRPGAACAVIENGVEPAPLAAAAVEAEAAAEHARAGAGPGRAPRVVVLGRIHPVKNLELALRALARLRAEAGPGAAATLTLAGPAPDPGYVERLRALARALGIESAVRWPGLVTGADKARLLSESDVLWLCSHMESFGNVVVEALAAGTPVVAVQATPWALLEPAQAGRHVPADAGAIAAATVGLLREAADPAARAASRARRQALVAARFSWDAVAARVQALYGAAGAARQ